MNRPRRLVDIQASQVEVGRIRLGTTEAKQGRRGEYRKPVKLTHFRLTSRSERLIRQAAQQYGGEVQQWTPDAGGAPQWEVVIEATSIAVIVPPDACSQFYEQWAAGKCTRRCDGATELLSMQRCPCGPEPAAKKAAGCKPTTRLALMLAELPGIGVWRLESRGYYAAAELPAVADLLSRAGGNVPARLELEERSAQVPDPRDPTKLVTARFMVPVLHVEATPAQIVGTFGQVPPGVTASAPAPALSATPEPVRTQAQVAPQPSALAAAAQRELEATPEDQRALQQQWKMHAWYEDKIRAAERTDMERQGWTAKVRGETRLLSQFRDNLLTIIEQHFGEYPPADVGGVPFEQPASPPPPPAPSGSHSPSPMGEGPADDDDEFVAYEDDPQPAAAPPAPPAPPVAQPDDRPTAWTQVNLLAGQRGITASKLRELYKQFSQGGQVSGATAAQLWQFKAWLEAQ